MWRLNREKDKIDVSTYLDTLASDALHNGFTKEQLYKIVKRDYLGILIQGKPSDRSARFLYRIAKGSFCHYRGHENQKTELQIGNAILIDDMMIFIKNTDEYNYGRIMTIMRNDHPSTPRGVEFAKYNMKTDELVLEVDSLQEQRIVEAYIDLIQRKAERKQ